MFGFKIVRLGVPDLRTSALGVKLVRRGASPWSRGRVGLKKRHKTAQIQTFDPDLLLGRSTFTYIYFKGGVYSSTIGVGPLMGMPLASDRSGEKLHFDS